MDILMVYWRNIVSKHASVDGRLRSHLAQAHAESARHETGHGFTTDAFTLAGFASRHALQGTRFLHQCWVQLSRDPTDDAHVVARKLLIRCRHGR